MSATMSPFDEYKFFAESTQRLTERRLAASGTFITVHTAIFGVLSFVVGWTEATRWARLGVSLPLVAIGLLACLLWHQMIAQYRALIGWRYEQLIEMERSGELAGGYRMYTKELEAFYRRDSGRERFGFSRIEVWLPRLFAVIYVLYAAGVVVAAALDL
jgi:hypothetical protein